MPAVNVVPVPAGVNIRNAVDNVDDVHRMTIFPPESIGPNEKNGAVGALMPTVSESTIGSYE